MKIDSPMSMIGITSQSKNLVITNGTTPDEQVDIDFDELIISNASGLSFKLFDGDLTADNTDSGANGIDTGSVAVSTWYYIWVIYNPTTRTIASLLSVSTTLATITLPSGYTFGALVGAILTDGTSDFVLMHQKQNAVIVPVTNIINAGNETSYHEQSLAAVIPSIARKVGGYARVHIGTAYSEAIGYLSPSSGGTVGAQEFYYAGDTNTTSWKSDNSWDLDLINNSLWWKVGNSTYHRLTVYINRYSL